MCLFYFKWLLGYKKLFEKQVHQNILCKKGIPHSSIIFSFCIWICIFFLVFFSDLPASRYFTSNRFWKYLFWNTLTLNFISPSLPGCFYGNAVNGALWTIKVELGFYLILPLLVYILDRLSSVKKQNVLLVIVYILSVLWNFLLVRFALKLGLPKQLSYQLPGFMSFFVSGMAFVYNKDFFRKHASFMILPALIIFALHYITKTEIFMPFALTVMIMFLGNRLHFLSEVGRPVDYSYAMYLFHFPLINIFTYLGFFEKAPVFSILIIISAVLGMAFIAEKYIQQNINKKLSFRT